MIDVNKRDVRKTNQANPSLRGKQFWLENNIQNITV